MEHMWLHVCAVSRRLRGGDAGAGCAAVSGPRPKAACRAALHGRQLNPHPRGLTALAALGRSKPTRFISGPLGSICGGLESAFMLMNTSAITHTEFLC